jgi:signal transduction histidine kinase
MRKQSYKTQSRVVCQSIKRLRKQQAAQTPWAQKAFAEIATAVEALVAKGIQLESEFIQLRSSIANSETNTPTSSQEQLRALARRLQAVREEERTRVAREIHDVLAQEMTRLKLDLGWLARRLTQPGFPEQAPLLAEKLAGMNALTDSAIHSVQKIATELRPVVLDSLGLCAAIEWLAKDFQKHSGIQCVASVPAADVALNRDCATALFRVLQESLTNVARHAGATRVDIRFACSPVEMVLSVSDNGRGCTRKRLENPRAIGLLGMRERALLLGGECQISSQPGRGTTVEVRVPHCRMSGSSGL